MNLAKTTCAFCSRKFFRIIRQSNEAKKFGWRQFCSSSCLSQSRITGTIVHCGNPGCDKKVYRRLKEIKKVKRSFCSTSCAATINNVKFPKRIARKANCGQCGIVIIGQNQYCTKRCKWDAQIIGKEILSKWITKFYSKNQRVPVKRECPHYRSIRNVFGTWNKAVEAAGLHPNPVRFAERQLANDGHSCSSIAEKLIDNWLAEHGILHERNVFYPDRKHTADFLVNGTFIEFFGLSGELKEYDAHIQIKKGLAQKHHIPLLKIYPKDMYPLTKLDNMLSNALSVSTK